MHAGGSGTAVGGVVSHGGTAVAGGTNPLAIGTIHGGSIVDKRHKYHIGSIRFGTGGLVSLIVIAIMLLGGGTAAVIHIVSPPVNLDDVQGDWIYHDHAAETYTDVTLTVTGSEFRFLMDLYDRTEPSGERTGIQIECKGVVTADSSEAVFHVHFRAHQPIGNATNLTSWCPDWFSGIPSDSRETLELSSPSGEPIRFARSSST